MKAILLVFLLSWIGNLFAQAPDQKGLDLAIEGFRACLLKRDFSLLQPHLDESYTINEFKRPQADKIVPQLLAQWPLLIEFRVIDTKIEKDQIVISINYKYEGHFFGADESTSNCILTRSNTFINIEYFNSILGQAVRKH